jgi:predicted PurR-regulated permease PerM
MRSSRSAVSQTRAVWILAVLATLAFVRFAMELLVPIVVGVLISLALEPIVGWLERRRVPRLAGTLLVMGTLVGAAGLGVYSLRDDVVSAVEALPDTARRIREMVTEQFAGGTLERASQELRGEAPQPASASGSGQRPSGSVPATPAPAEAAASVLPVIGQSVFAVLGHITVVGFLVFFLLASGPRSTERVIAMADSPEQGATIGRILRDIFGQLERFLLVQASTAALVALSTWAVLAWVGMQQALLWGVLAGLFNTIPYFGPVVVSGGLFAVGLVQGGATTGLQTAGAALLITSLEGWLLTPVLMGKAERMNVLSVFIGVLLWTWLWGAWGTLLAVPMLAVLKSVADRVEGMKPLRRLMAA